MAAHALHLSCLGALLVLAPVVRAMAPPAAELERHPSVAHRAELFSPVAPAGAGPRGRALQAQCGNLLDGKYGKGYCATRTSHCSTASFKAQCEEACDDCNNVQCTVGEAGAYPCSNGGTCENLMVAGTYKWRCACKAGFVGQLCASKIGCWPPCEHGGECNPTTAKCACPRGYGGPGCAVSKKNPSAVAACGTQHTMNQMFKRIEKTCCVLPNGKRSSCANGPPKDCSLACSGVFMTMWDKCSSVMQLMQNEFTGFAETCRRTAANAANTGGVSAATSLVDPFNVQCQVNTKYPFKWVEISTRRLNKRGHPRRNGMNAQNTGIRISREMWTSNGMNRWQSDDGWFDVTLPTTGAWANGFNYYGQSEKIISIGTNGLITFGTPQFKYGATEPVPCSGRTVCADGKSRGLGIDGLIALMWADLYPGASGGDVYYLVTNTSMIIEYATVKSWSYQCTQQRSTCFNLPDPGQSFQVILYPSGEFVFNYLSMYCKTCLTSWSSTSIGFEDQSGLKGEQITYGQIPADKTSYYVPASCTNAQFGGGGGPGASQT